MVKDNFYLMKRAFILLCTVLGLIGCAPSRFPIAGSVTVSLSDSGNAASLIPNQALVVRLPANPSTGYVWRYTVTGDDVLRLVTVDEEAPAPNGMVGMARDEEWSFRAQGAGRAELTYVYERPWEKNTPPAKTFTLSVTVSPGN